MKGWLVVATVLGFVFTFFLFIFLYGYTVTAGICYYSNELVTNSANFVNEHADDLNLTNEDIIKIINNCFVKKTASFESYFNLNQSDSNSDTTNNNDDIRTTPSDTSSLINDASGRRLETAPVTTSEKYDTSLLSDF